jgi:hypothetical protein
MSRTQIAQIPLGRPGFIAIHPHACIAVGESLAELLFPARDDSLGIEYAIHDIPLGMRNDFDIASGKVTGRTRKGLEQSQPGLLFTKGIKEERDAEPALSCKWA